MEIPTQFVTIGGGRGHSQVLRALKQISNIQITGICTSTDSGGSTGILQKEYAGHGYVGDLTRCIVALCDDAALADALSYRYENGPLNLHSVKNLLFHALEQVRDPHTALEVMWRVCGLGNNRVLPVTNEKAELCAKLQIGNTISGEANIDTLAKNPLWNPEVHSISEVFLKPEVQASHEALDAFKKADYLVVCQGDLYSSILPVLLPKGVTEAIQSSSAKIILILNIMTKKGETDNYTATDFVEKIEKYLGKRVDHIVYNCTPIPNEVLLKYALEQKVELGSFSDFHDPRVIKAPLAEFSESGRVTSNPEELRKTIEQIRKY